jgi:acid phosphatase family membrane protein YuiD
VVAFIVMYDAANVRKAAGEQAKILNYMMDHWKEMRPAFRSKELKELLGHTPLQVFAGAVLGVAIAVVGIYLHA